MFTSGSAEKTGEKGNKGNTDQRNTAASHKLLNALRLSTGIILTISFQKVDSAPNTERTAEGYNEGLQSFDCRVKEFHIVPIRHISCRLSYSKIVVWFVNGRRYMESGFCANWWIQMFTSTGSAELSPAFIYKNFRCVSCQRIRGFHKHQRYHLVLSLVWSRGISQCRTCSFHPRPTDICSLGAL